MQRDRQPAALHALGGRREPDVSVGLHALPENSGGAVDGDPAPGAPPPAAPSLP